MEAFDKQVADAETTPRITPRQEDQLTLFFCSLDHSAQRSNFGAMTERLSLFGQRANRCEAGCARGIEASGMICRVCRGTGLSKPERIGDPGDGFFATEPCPRCRGRCGDEGCTVCRGLGYVSGEMSAGDPEISGHHYEPNGDLIRMTGGMRSRIARLRSADVTSAVVLELYYGPIGNRWGSRDIGRGFAVWPVTKSGRRLIEESRKKSESAHTLEIGAHDLLFEEHEAERRARNGGNPNPHRKALLDGAARQAVLLLDRAQKSWALLSRSVA